jgi:myo-inositol-1-phosphate synthase
MWASTRRNASATGAEFTPRGSRLRRRRLNLEYKLEVWDCPNSAGIIIDAIRAAKIAKDRGNSGVLICASSHLMKSPPVQRPDDLGNAKLEAYIAGTDEH